MNSRGLSISRSVLPIEAGLEAKIVGFSDDAYERFSSARQAAEGVLEHLLVMFADLPAFEVIFADIYLLIGSDELGRTFSVGSCSDLRDDPEWMPGKTKPSTIIVNVLLPATGRLVNIHTVHAPQASLLIDADVKAQLCCLSKDAYARFLSAKLHAEAVLKYLLRHLKVLPILEIVSDGIHLLVGFHRHSERFFISNCFDLREDPESPDHPPGNARPVSVTVSIRVVVVGLVLNNSQEEGLCDKHRTLNIERGFDVGILDDGNARSLRLTTEFSFAGDFDHRGIVGTGLIGFDPSLMSACKPVPVTLGDAFVLGVMLDALRPSGFRTRRDRRILACAPTDADKGMVGIIPDLPHSGSAFVLSFERQDYTVIANARRPAGQRVIVVDPFGITGASTHALNWLDTLDPDSPNVGGRAAGLADMLIVADGADVESHWNDSARGLLRGLLIYVAGLPIDRRTMSELRRIVTASENEFSDTLMRMQANLEFGQHIPARAAAAHLDRPARERRSILSSIVHHTAWLDDPRLCAALARSEFSLADLKRQPMTVYLVIPPDRLHASLGFVRGFIGLALDIVTATKARPMHQVAFLLDEIGRLGQMDSLTDSVSRLRSHGVQVSLSNANLSRTMAMYSRKQTCETDRPNGRISLDWQSNLSESLVANLCSRRWPGAGSTTWKEHSW